MKKARFLHHIWVLITVLPVWIVLASGCGLPQYASLEKPIPLDQSGTVLGFTTPADTNVTGYALYYKYYTDSETDLIQEDADQFDENNYINDEDELPPGDKKPRERGFVLAGNFGEDGLNTSTFKNPGPGIDILIDFDDDAPPRSEPIVTNLVPGPLTLARGFIDHRDIDDTLRRFVNDWYFTLPDGFTDGDLCRPPGQQPGFEGDKKGGDPLPDISNTNNLIVSFVVHSVGIDPTILRPLDSQPVFLGSIVYTDINSTTDREL